MRLFVHDEEIETVRKNLENAPAISEALGIGWVKSNLLQKEERFKKHTMFWLLLDQTKSGQLENWLSILKSTIPNTKFVKIVNALKEKKSEHEFFSFIPEIEVMSYYKMCENACFKVEYEPSIPNKSNVGDIKLTFDSKGVFLEITRLFSSKEEEQIDKTTRTISAKINEMEDNPFIITFEIREDFSESDIDPCIDFVHQKIIERKSNSEKSDEEPFTIDFDEKASFKLYGNMKNEKGYAGGTIWPVRLIKPAGRLKNKILDKVEQLPENHYNVIVLDISHYFLDFIDVEDAFAGRLGYRIDLKTMEGTPFRYANGIVHMKQGNQIGAIIAFKGFDYEHRRKYINPSAALSFTDEMISKI